MIIREALPAEAEAAGELRVAAYAGQHLLDVNPAYEPILRGLGFDGPGTVLVAAADGPGGKLAGTVMYEPWHAGSEVARSAEEAEVRALAVAPWAQGRGTGRALMRAVIGQAEAAGVARLLLSTQPAMVTAQRLYRSMGFDRAPELDWEPVPGVTLMGFVLRLSRR